MKNWNLLFRRTHLYLGMILLPWMVMYAVSTIAFNHGEHFRKPAEIKWLPLWEKDYAADVPATEDDLRVFARRILDENGLQGAFGVQRQGGQRLTIQLPNFLNPTRVTYDIAQKKLRAEAKERLAYDVLARLHTRTGYGRAGVLQNIWAFMVDAWCITTLIWILTGLYLWWKLPMTRTWGFVAMGGGVATIVILLATL
ncbi:MAG TPA: PepSY-associated TM helix domain-containing protein [Opitutaceae bacterium]|nr:PepSY-associated TM helix domain-containing protein [Opitutaceae bacterium]